MAKRNISLFSEEVLNLMPYLVRGMFRKHKDELAKGYLSLPQFLTLDLIDTHGSLKMKEIARELNISLPAATGIIDRLHHSGMVKREPDLKDRRVIRVVLAPKGKKILENTRRARREAIEEIFSCLSEKERENYLNTLRKIKSVLYGKERSKK